jgi:DNA-directed RNA polymerase subunit RPC12/RpoP
METTVSFTIQEPKHYDVIIVPSRLRENFRWLFCQNCGHRIMGVYVDKIVNADTGVYRNVETSYTMHYDCRDCHSLVRIVLATEVS